MNKLLEKTIEKRLRNFLETNNFIFERQLGFREHHSTTLALVEATNNIRKELYNGKAVLGLYLDLRTAFAR